MIDRARCPEIGSSLSSGKPAALPGLVAGALALLPLAGCSLPGLAGGGNETLDALEGAARLVVRLEVPLAGDSLVDRRRVSTGVLWGDEGWVVSCAHGLEGRDPGRPLRARLSDGSEHEASVVGTSEVLDLCLLRLSAPSPAGERPVGRPRVRVGEPVYVLGFPLQNVIVDRAPSVTAGIVSAVDREVATGIHTPTLMGMIQLDAVVSSGSSGGPVVDADGRLVGVVLLSANGADDAWRGAAFALPAESVAEFVEEAVREHARSDSES